MSGVKCTDNGDFVLEGTGESLGEDMGDITGDENGAGLLLAGLRMNDFSFSGFTLPYRKKNDDNKQTLILINLN